MEEIEKVEECEKEIKLNKKREIEFRAKDRTGIMNFDWFYGSLDLTTNKEFPKIICKDRFGNTMFIDTDKETIGQYTGLKDKNGKKIFEGDIVKLTETNYNYEWTAVVEFGNPNGEYVWGWNLKPITKDVECNLDILCWVEMPIGATCEVIGNIYDNPELIGE